MDATTTQQVQDRVRKLVERVQGLPTLPSMLNNINQMVLNPKTSAREVAQLISSDPSLTSKVLRVVNSSFYGFPNRITTVTHAIVILGFNTIKSIVLSSTIFDVFRRTPPPRRFRPGRILEALHRLRRRGQGDRPPPQLPDAGGAVHRRAPA